MYVYAEVDTCMCRHMSVKITSHIKHTHRKTLEQRKWSKGHTVTSKKEKNMKGNGRKKWETDQHIHKGTFKRTFLVNLNKKREKQKEQISIEIR